MTTHEHLETPFGERIDVEHPTQEMTVRDILQEADTTGIPEDILAEPIDLADVEVARDPRTKSVLMRVKEHPWVIKATLVGGALATQVQYVAATEMNWTPIGNMLEGLADIMPSVSSLVMAIVPVLITLLVVGFITGLLDGIIDAIRSGTKLFR